MQRGYLIDTSPHYHKIKNLCIKIVNTDDKTVEMLATEIGKKLVQTNRQHAQTDNSSLQRSDGLGHRHRRCKRRRDDRHAEQSADEPADRAAGPWTRWPPPHTPTAHNAQRAIQDRNKRVYTNYRYDNKTTNSTVKSDIIQKCTNTTERASCRHTAENRPSHTTM